MYLMCTLNVPDMYRTCTWYVPCVYLICTRPVPDMYSFCVTSITLSTQYHFFGPLFDATPWNPSFFLGLRKTNFKADDLELCWHVQLCCRIAPQVHFFTAHNFHRNKMPRDLPYDRQVASKINRTPVGQPLIARFGSFCFGIWRHQNAAKNAKFT